MINSKHLRIIGVILISSFFVLQFLKFSSPVELLLALSNLKVFPKRMQSEVAKLLNSLAKGSYARQKLVPYEFNYKGKRIKIYVDREKKFTKEEKLKYYKAIQIIEKNSKNLR